MTLNENQRLAKDSGNGISNQLGSPTSGYTNNKLHSIISEEIRYTHTHYHGKMEFGSDTEKSLNHLFEFYHNKMALMDKIDTQNKKLKEKLEEVEDFKENGVGSPKPNDSLLK
jgi:hypothetical protein